MARMAPYGGIRIAGGGTEGVAELVERRFELVSTDAELPGTDALAQGRRLVTHRPPVLLLSARDAHALRREWRGRRHGRPPRRARRPRRGGRLSPAP
ncbi:hypothetical protein [Streptomyces sp. NPDC088847]|uniref:hypothetical protein n=1 Tax=Streptomyces sp. NPDC088847 TaxID=3365909 RepID=UPI0037F1EEDD